MSLYNRATKSRILSQGYPQQYVAGTHLYARTTERYPLTRFPRSRFKGTSITSSSLGGNTSPPKKTVCETVLPDRLPTESKLRSPAL